MIWEHTCSLEWLQARQRFLTATDVKDLLPFTKTGRKRTVTDDDRIKVLARKYHEITAGDCRSSGAAARGHLLEPFAIELLNKALQENLYHWDDIVITRETWSNMDLAFSPDAMSIPPNDLPIWGSMLHGLDGYPDITIAEVKSYNPERHYSAGYSKKAELEERWQIAVAMAVLPEIKNAYLVFYNPSMDRQMFVFEYTRNDLEDEISTVLDIETSWNFFVNQKRYTEAGVVRGGKTEAEIVEEIAARPQLNPPM